MIDKTMCACGKEEVTRDFAQYLQEEGHIIRHTAKGPCHEARSQDCAGVGEWIGATDLPRHDATRSVVRFCFLCLAATIALAIISRWLT